MLAEHESGLLYAVEILLWSVPTLLACALVQRYPAGTRIAWAILGAACLCIVLDKAFDILSVVHKTGQKIVDVVDPDTRMRGEHLIYRYLLLGGLLGGGSVGLVYCLRRDGDRSRGKVIALTGLVLVLVYIAARLVPGLKDHLAPPTGWAIEGACYAIILWGLVIGWRTKVT